MMGSLSPLHDHTVNCLEYYLGQVMARWAVFLPLLRQPEMNIRLRNLVSTSTSFVRRLEEVLSDIESHQYTPSSPVALLHESRKEDWRADPMSGTCCCLSSHSELPSCPMPMTEVSIDKRREPRWW